jgi:dTDP-4-amino-4,6-dideoxygalactose transaminase
MNRIPAILGGAPSVQIEGTHANRWPLLTEEDEEAVLRVIRDGNLSCHPVTRELENDYANFFESRHALAHCNGTAALLAAFFALDLQPGDEILVPSATFWASVVPMLWVGAVPVFCESELEQIGLDPEDVERKITNRTRAIVIVHLWGMPSKMNELMEIANQHHLRIIEDASHAHGATYHGKKCGTFGDISVFSLQSSKLAPAGEGGILLTNKDEYWERAVGLGDMMRIFELDSPARAFAGTTFGLKTRMAPLSAAIGRVQFRHLHERNAKRNWNLRYLSDRLENYGFQTFLPPPGIERVYFEFLIRCNVQRIGMPVQTLIEALQAEGCEVSFPRYPLLHQQPLFTDGHFRKILRTQGEHTSSMMYMPNALPKTEAVMNELIRLPSFPFAEKDLLDQYLEAFEKVLNYSEEIGQRTLTRA